MTVNKLQCLQSCQPCYTNRLRYFPFIDVRFVAFDNTRQHLAHVRCVTRDCVLTPSTPSNFLSDSENSVRR